MLANLMMLKNSIAVAGSHGKTTVTCIMAHIFTEAGLDPTYIIGGKVKSFESNAKLKTMTIDFLEDIICTPTLLPSEHRASSQLLRMLTKDEPTQNKINLEQLLSPVQVSKYVCT